MGHMHVKVVGQTQLPCLLRVHRSLRNPFVSSVHPSLRLLLQKRRR